MKNIILCGSMKVKDKILEVAEALEKDGYNVLVPKECFEDLDKILLLEFILIKYVIQIMK